MTRPDQDSTAQRILGLATEHVRRFGHGRTTIVGVAADAGMTHANVYRYFPSKMALGDAITAAWLKPIEAALLDTAHAPDPADDKLERMVVTLARGYRAQLEAEPNLFALFAEGFEKSRAVARKHRSRVRELFERVMEDAVGEGLLERRDKARSLSLLFDVSHRFIQPSCLISDRELSRAAFDQRLSAVLSAALRVINARRPRERTGENA